MVSRIKRRVAIEHYYFKQLSREGRSLLHSLALFSLAEPLLVMFINTFLWRASSDLMLIAWYNLAIFVGLPAGFYANGRLLRRFAPMKLFRYSVVTRAIVAMVILFFAANSYDRIIVLGFLSGFSSGIFWANKNLFTLIFTKPRNRIYFSSIEAGLFSVGGILMPLVAGWFIVMGETYGWYSVGTAYRAIGLAAFVILVAAGYMMRNVAVSIPQIQRIVLRRTSRNWNHSRLLVYTRGLQSGILTFLPTLMVVMFVGNEGALGSLQSVAALLSSVVIYCVARKANITHRLAITAIGVACCAAAGLIFGIMYSAVGVLVFFAFSALGNPFSAIGINPLLQDVIEHEEERHKSHQFSYIFDHELFLNLGRASSVIGFIVFAESAQAITVRMSPLVIAGVQVAIILSAKKMTDHIGLRHTQAS